VGEGGYERRVKNERERRTEQICSLLLLLDLFSVYSFLLSDPFYER
jgi:hypothetical protein